MQFGARRGGVHIDGLRVRAGAGIGATIALVLTAFGSVPASAATQDFTVAGEYAVTAPPGTTCATFVVDGAHGGAANTLGRPESPGGAGGEVTVSVAATAGTTFDRVVGGHGGDATTTAPGAGGSNGGGSGGLGFFQSVGELSGGGGGGATSVAQGATTLAIAAGGGGGGSNVLDAGAGGAGGGGGGDGNVVETGAGDPGAGGGGGSSIVTTDALGFSFGVAPGLGDGAVHVTFSSGECPPPPPPEPPAPPAPPAPAVNVTIQPRFTG